MNNVTTAAVPQFRSLEDLDSGLNHIREAPKNCGVLKLIVARPNTDQRKVLQEARLDLVSGLDGDNWKSRGSSRTPDGSANPDMQLTLMNARVIDRLSGDQEFWPLAGDQLFVDLDLSVENVPAGTQLEIGSAVIEVTPPPHTGCKKFAARFGTDATRFVNSLEGRRLQLRGICAKVVRPGVVRVGDPVTKIS